MANAMGMTYGQKVTFHCVAPALQVEKVPGFML
jgi:hypothetical protein